MGVMHIIGDIFILVGAFNFAVCSLGLVSFRDFYARVSAVGTAGGFGAAFVVLGVWFKSPTAEGFIMALAAILLLLGTSAFGSMLIARSAVLRGTQMHHPIGDELGVLTPEDFEARDGRRPDPHRPASRSAVRYPQNSGNV